MRGPVDFTVQYAETLLGMIEENTIGDETVLL